MNHNNARQRIRREEIRFNGNSESVKFQNEEHSVFLENGNIVSRERRESPVIQGVIPHQPNDIAGQCQSCFGFTTKLIICEHCWQVVCLPCASLRKNKKVCPTCFRYLEHRRWILIFRKLFIEPFVERVG